MGPTSPAGNAASAPALRSAQRMVLPILVAIAFSHLLNDTVQSLIPASAA